MRSLRIMMASSLVVGLAAGCQLISGADDIPFQTADSSTATSSGGGATGGTSQTGGGDQGGGGQGGDAQGGGGVGGGGGQGGDGGQGGEEPTTCMMPEECPGTNAECQMRTCVMEECGIDFDGMGTSCNGGVCDGSGTCVECNLTQDCTMGQCVDNICVPASCTNNIEDGMETDIDCGGPTCAPCALGQACAGEDDNCATKFCSGNECQSCMGHTDCDANRYCDTTSGICLPDKQTGESCNAGEMCGNGHCVDGVCCESACTMSCRSCLAPGFAAGTCSPLDNNSQDTCGLTQCCQMGMCTTCLP